MIEWKPQVLCVFGRGIEKVPNKDQPLGYTWQPTAYLERLSEKNSHSGWRVEDITPFDEDPRVVIAGSEVNVVACAMFYKELALAGAPPEVITFAAGRPAYLEKEREYFTEGRVLYEKFLEFSHHTRAEVVFQEDNRTTRDDITQTLKLARERKLQRITIITVAIHIPRCREFMKHIPPGLLEGTEIRWFASEPIVLRYFPEKHAALWEAMISPAYARTAERERKGIRDLREGRYDFGSARYAFAKK